MVNRLIAKALSEAADPEALKLARRFPFSYRYDIYRAGATSPRFLQLTSVFPLLATVIAGAELNWARLKAQHLVEIGAPLKKIADFASIPMALRKVKPGATALASRSHEIFANDPNLIHAYMPQSLPRMRRWLGAIALAKDRSRSLEFAEFVAKNFSELNSVNNERMAWVEDTADWVRACAHPEHRGGEFVTRGFRPDMSVKTVNALSDEWHAAAAANWL